MVRGKRSKIYGSKDVRNKERVTGFISPRAKKKLKEFVETGVFASESDFVTEAVIEKLFRERQEDKKQIIAEGEI